MLDEIYRKTFPEVAQAPGMLTRIKHVREKLANISAEKGDLLAINLSKKIKDTLDAGGSVSLTTPKRPSTEVGNEFRKEFPLSNGKKVIIYWNHAYSVLSVDTKNTQTKDDDEVTIGNPHGTLAPADGPMQTHVIPLEDVMLGTLFDGIYW